MKIPDNLQRPNTTHLPERCTNSEYSLSAWSRFLWVFFESILPDVDIAQLDDKTDLRIRNYGLNFQVQPKKKQLNQRCTKISSRFKVLMAQYKPIQPNQNQLVT